MYMMDGEAEVNPQPTLAVALTIAVVATVILGFIPGPWFEIAREAAFNGVTALAGS